LGIFYSDVEPDNDPLEGPVRDILDWIGDWKYWCLMVGIILIIAGGWYFFDNIRKRREFKELMEITSKKKFIQNLDRVEYLAWKLTPWHRIEVSKKKKKFHIK
jgi:hypothetical protein